MQREPREASTSVLVLLQCKYLWSGHGTDPKRFSRKDFPFLPRKSQLCSLRSQFVALETCEYTNKRTKTKSLSYCSKMLDPQGLNAPPPASSETPKAASNNTTANTTDESVTLSRLSGDELLSILRQSLAVGAKRAAKQPAAPEVPRPPVDAGASIPLVAADKDTKGLCASSLASGLRLGAASQETLVGASDVDAEEPYCPAGGEEGDPASLSAKSVPFPSSLAPFSAPSTSKDSSASTMYTSASASTPMDEDVELSTNAFLKDVLSEGVAQTSHMTPNIGPQLPFLLGSISAALGLAENLSFQHTQLLSEQEALKSNTLVKRAALKSIGDKTRLAKEQYENALRHLDLATIAFKDAEAAETSLEARLNIAAEMKERANSRVSQAIKEARALCLSVPLEWVDLVGPHIVRLVEGTPKSSHLSDSLTPPEPSPLRVQTFDFGELLTPTASSSTDRRVTGPGQPTVQFTMSPSSGSPASSVSVSRQGHGARRVTSSSSESALSRAPPLSSHSSSSTTSLKRRADDICVAFNQGACTLSSDTCDKTHSCLFCSGAHPVIRCGPEKSSERIFCVQWNVDEVSLLFFEAAHTRSSFYLDPI